MSDPKHNTDLVAVRDEKTGRFLKGNAGRPIGSKNRITLLKVALEEAFREDAYDQVLEVLQQVVLQALSGDKSSQRLVWESAVSKGIQATDKEVGDKKGFTVHHMHHDIEAKADKEKEDG